MTDLYLVLHVVGAVGWVGASTMFHIFGRRVEAANDETVMRQFLTDGAWLSMRFFIPISLLTVAMGFALVIDSDFIKFSDPFVSAGLTMFVISFAMGAGFLGPQTEKMLGRINAGEFGQPTMTAQINRVMMVSSIELVLLWATVVVMVLKPG